MATFAVAKRIAETFRTPSGMHGVWHTIVRRSTNCRTPGAAPSSVATPPSSMASSVARLLLYKMEPHSSSKSRRRARRLCRSLLPQPETHSSSTRGGRQGQGRRGSCHHGRVIIIIIIMGRLGGLVSWTAHGRRLIANHPVVPTVRAVETPSQPAGSTSHQLKDEPSQAVAGQPSWLEQKVLLHVALHERRPLF